MHATCVRMCVCVSLSFFLFLSLSVSVVVCVCVCVCVRVYLLRQEGGRIDVIDIRHAYR
jgi:hypothetical protein